MYKMELLRKYCNYLELEKEIEKGTLRIGLTWEAHKRLFSLFTNYEEFEKSLIYSFNEWLYANNKNNYITVSPLSASSTITGVTFTVSIPLEYFIFYSSEIFTPVTLNNDSCFKEKHLDKIPLNTPIIIKYLHTYDNKKYMDMVTVEWEKDFITLFNGRHEKWDLLTENSCNVLSYKAVE